MADSPILPGDRAWRDASGNPLPIEFYRFMRDLTTFVREATGNTESVASVLARVVALEGATEATATLAGPYSVAVFGSLESGAIAQLVNDAGDPGNSYYYGTSDAGVKGWHALGAPAVTTETTASVSPTAMSGQTVLLCDCTANAITVNLPTAVGNSALYSIKKTDVSVNTVTIDADGAETIDGAATAVITVQFASLTLVSDGSNWYVI
jgi:hypothetical protein